MAETKVVQYGMFRVTIKQEGEKGGGKNQGTDSSTLWVAPSDRQHAGARSDGGTTIFLGPDDDDYIAVEEAVDEVLYRRWEALMSQTKAAAVVCPNPRKTRPQRTRAR